MARLTDSQLIILSAASQRDDRGVELPANVQGKAARKIVDKPFASGTKAAAVLLRRHHRLFCSIDSCEASACNA